MYLTIRIRKKLNTKDYTDLDKWGQSVDAFIVAISQTLRSHGVEFCVPPIDYKAGLVIYSPAAPVVFKAILSAKRLSLLKHCRYLLYSMISKTISISSLQPTNQE